VPHYFFDVRNNEQLAFDEVGLELSDLRAAVAQAAHALADSADQMVEGSLRQELAVEIRTALHVAVLRVTLSLEFYDATIPAKLSLS
jgi:hypothetical protein